MTEIYADWNLEEQTGLILGIFERPSGIALKDCPKEIKNQKFLKAVEEVFEKVQKVPDSFEIYSLNDRTVLIERSGIFIHIEIELIRAGFFEELKLVKRPLERKMLEQLELGQNIREVFLDWNFDEDKGVIILILQPEKS
nr:hypothetical protein [Planococcus glaciei]